jgi:hypothetical protein
MYKRWVAGEIKGEDLHKARVELIQLCDRAFLTKTREEWVDVFQHYGVWHEKVSRNESHTGLLVCCLSQTDFGF